MERGKTLKLICPHCGKRYNNPSIVIADQAELLSFFKENTVPYRILTILGEHFDRWVATEELIWQIWPQDGLIDARTCLGVNAFQMRKRIQPYGYTIVGQGHAYQGAYKLTKKEGPRKRPRASHGMPEVAEAPADPA